MELPGGRLLLLFVVGVLVAPWAAWKTEAETGVYSSGQAKRGASLYLRHCESCHGTNGMGSEGGPSLAGVDFDDVWKGQKLSNLFTRIKTTMPQSAPASLSDQQYADLVALILSFNRAPSGNSELPPQVEALEKITYGGAAPR